MFTFIDFVFLIVLAGAAVLVLEKIEEEIIEEYEKERARKLFGIQLNENIVNGDSIEEESDEI